MHRPVDAHVAPGRLLHLRDQPILVGVDRDHRGHHQRRHDEEDDENADDDADPDCELFHDRLTSFGCERA